MALTDWILQASYNPVAYVGNPRLGTALQLLQTTDFVESKLHQVSYFRYDFDLFQDNDNVLMIGRSLCRVLCVSFFQNHTSLITGNILFESPGVKLD